jgi:predicted metal-dependent peptidase
MESLELRLEVSASKMGLRVPFIMAATGKLPRIVVDDRPEFTAATDGSYLKFGRVWVEAKVADDEELFGLDLHERMHVVLMHMWRREGRDPDVWNIANDAIINATILSMGYRLPKGGIHISWVTVDMSSEDVYNKLMSEGDTAHDDDYAGGSGNGSGGTPGQGSAGRKTKCKAKHGKGGWDKQGDLLDAPDNATAADMEATIRAAAQMARDCGDTSALVNRILGATPKASVNWKDEVRAALTSAGRDDFSFRKLNRRFVGRGMYMPSLLSDAMGGLLIGFDTSGSMSAEDCKQVGGEIQGIISDLNPDWVEVVYCDAKIGNVQRFERDEALELRPVGGGGTAFLPVFKHAEKMKDNGHKVAAMIYLTDMESGDLMSLEEPEFPVVWGNVYGRECPVPFGKMVRVIV